MRPMADADGTGQQDTGADAVPERLLALQAIDTEADQLRLRRERLPEREEVTVQTELLRAWEERRKLLRHRLDELEQAIDTAESESTAIGENTTRLEAQLKTVIAPREAEALMHEIDTLTARRDDLETAELAALEEQAAVDDDLSAHLVDEGALREAHRAAEAVLAERLAEVDLELARIAERRAEVRTTVPDGLLDRYDAVRAQLGVAVARLDGRRCDGCHLDLSAAEVDDARDAAAASGMTDCPHCGRMLVV